MNTTFPGGAHGQGESSLASPTAELATWLPRGDIVAVLRGKNCDRVQAVVETLAEQGITTVELTLTTPGVLEESTRLAGMLGDRVRLGIGSVRSVADALAAIDSGARYLVSPGLVPGAVEFARGRGVPFLGGALTPSEAMAQLECGAEAVKIFPASTVGPEYLAHLHGPLPGVPLVPSGGIGIEAVPAWFAAGAWAISLGGPLVGDALSPHGDLSALAVRARRVVGLSAEFADRGLASSAPARDEAAASGPTEGGRA